MKLLLWFILFSMLNVSGSIFSQNTTFDLSVNSKTVKEVFKDIESQSSHRLLYNDEFAGLSRIVSFNTKDNNIDEGLNELLAGAHLTYRELENELIVITPADFINQEHDVTGRVTDAATGEPLPGVTVMIKGTTTGTVTDVDGNFNLSSVPPLSVLTFSFIGMRTLEIEVGDQTVINAALDAEAVLLDEVVAIGYGTARKSDLTGSVSSVSGTDVAGRKATQVSQALQGAMAGVMVTRTNNAPGATSNIRIRGITTIGDSNPLIIVDGVPVDDINWINPNDVADISVLKDAASAAIYGARAAAGVILITTKRAESGQLSLSFNTEYGFETPTSLPQFGDVNRYMAIKNELRWNDNYNDEYEYPRFSKDYVENYMSRHAENPDLYPNVNMMDLIYKDRAPRQTHNLSISAGTDAITSQFSLTFDETEGLYYHRSYERLSVRLNNDVTINDFISATLDLNYRRAYRQRPRLEPGYLTHIHAPIYTHEWSDGRVAGGKDGGNVYGEIKYGGTRDDYWNQAGGKMSLDLTPLEGLTLSAVVAPQTNFNKSKNWQLQNPYTAWDDPTQVVGYLTSGFFTNLYEGRSDNYQVTSQVLLNYAQTTDDHRLDFLAGYEHFYAFYESMGGSRERFDLTSFPYLNIGPLGFRHNYGNAYENAYRSWFGRVMYSYMNRYMLQANIRYDASSRFHPDYRWGSFPSLSAGWVMTEESFMQDIPIYLKLRGSWGNLGNERIGNYPYQATVGFDNALFHQGSNVVATQSAAQWQYNIHDISWETTQTYGVGLDLGLLNNRVILTGDYYQKTTEDMLLALEIPDFMGFNNPDQNTGEMSTKGWELEAVYNDHVGEFSYTVNFNISDYKTLMGDLGGTEFLGAQIIREGSQYNEWYGYLSDGLFQTQDEVDTSPVTSASVRPGDVKYIDVSGPDDVEDGVISPEYDRVYLGGSLPRYLYGGSIFLGWRGIDFNLVVQGVGKQNSRMSGTMVEPVINNWGNIADHVDGNYWSMYNTAEENLDAKYPRLSRINRGNNYTMSDFWLINGAYFRLKNITLGYTLPQNLSERLSMNNVRFYATLTDIYTYNHYPKGWDPEVAGTNYPITSSILFGASVNF